ncbi:MAG TPA: hypothetical protein VMI93_11925 [Candidatus Solibacter sp.]|nr:hypothetical protein [Candidatus Solibacter sp.]
MRLLVALWRAIRTFLDTLWRVTRQLFHEVAGSAFLLLSFGGGLSTWRYWRALPPGSHAPSQFWAVGLAASFTLMMAAFSVSSFRSARRVR